ncbi:hypothetical protein GWO13_04190 [Candidatus Bathyarchaeota archaeon]|nr:hypothetical protein [Candidatus Bathyarchaeota archaeon]
MCKKEIASRSAEFSKANALKSSLRNANVTVKVVDIGQSTMEITLIVPSRSKNKTNKGRRSRYPIERKPTTVSAIEALAFST